LWWSSLWTLVILWFFLSFSSFHQSSYLTTHLWARFSDLILSSRSFSASWFISSCSFSAIQLRSSHSFLCHHNSAQASLKVFRLSTHFGLSVVAKVEMVHVPIEYAGIYAVSFLYWCCCERLNFNCVSTVHETIWYLQ